MASYVLTDEQVDAFNRDGFLVIPSFYDRDEVESIQRVIYNLIGLVIRKYDLPVEQAPFSPENFDTGFADVIARDRKLGGEIYDAVKQIPAFVRLCASQKHDDVFCRIRQTDMPGVAAGGYGIRIDNPGEEKFRAGWHQDYPAQFRSLDGLVFWSPLIAMTGEMGAVRLCAGSHKDGLVRVYTRDSRHADKKGAYGLVFENEQAVVDRYEKTAPLLGPTDLLIIDFLTVHSSGYNTSGRSRWTMQMRYFNFREPTGIDLGWVGSFAAGIDVRTVHPDLFID